jgi:hypothetical protein
MRRDIKIDEVRALIALVDGGSLMNAAAIVGRTESALSLQLKRLEDSAGVALLQKQGRRLALTRAGRVVLEHGRKLIAAQDELRDLACPRDRDCPRDRARPTAGAPAPTERRETTMPIDEMVLSGPMRVTLSPEGQFREMRPVQSFRQTLGGPLLRAAYDYWMARCQRHEPVDFGAISALLERCGPHYVVAVIRLAVDQRPEMQEVASDLGRNAENDSLSGGAAGPLAQSCTKVMSLLRHVHKIEMPIAWSGVCILESHQAHCSRSLALPLCHNGGACDTVLLVSEVSLTERYHFPANACDQALAPEMVQVSTDDHIAPPNYQLKPATLAARNTARAMQHAA